VTANLLTGLGIDQVFTRTDSTGTRELFSDALGSTVALANTSGAVQTSYTYEPFGGTTQTGTASTNSYKYTGREDDGTGLYYYRARYYSPRLQRFLSEDPIGFAGGSFSLYTYVGGDPVSRIDPNGLGPISFGACTLLSGLWDYYQVGRDISALEESTRETRDILNRVNSEISQCPSKDMKRLTGLENIRDSLKGQLVKTVQERGAATRQSSLLQVPQGAILEAICAMAGIFGPW
jgi:RHS repeat-associated protein